MTKAPSRNDRGLVQPVSAGQPNFGLPLDLSPMDARTADTLPDFEGPWQYEPKWDGFRCLAFKAAGTVELRAKSGKPLGRFFPKIVTLSVIASPSSNRATNRRRSSITKHSFHVIHPSPKADMPRGRCYPCVRYEALPMSRVGHAIRPWLCTKPTRIREKPHPLLERS
jgi:hypothetical protein